jgi:tRNA dimethylallyltransferase
LAPSRPCRERGFALESYPLVIVAGPTGSGKSQIAMQLARMFDGEIVSCDALQVYRGMDIGTAKATPSEREAVPHHMLDLQDPGEDFSAGDYQRLARQALDGIRRRGRIPFVVGGTGLYLRALLLGLFEGPGRRNELRARLQKIARSRKAASLHRILLQADPMSAGRISAADTARIIRALEVYFLTGKPISWWQNQPAQRLAGFRWLKLGIHWPREMLYQRINARTHEMFERGLIEEVGRLLDKFPHDCNAFKAIGYRQVSDYFANKLGFEQTIEEVKRQSRRYAKRQLTWFRADPEIVWLDGASREPSLILEANAAVHTFIESSRLHG